MVYMLLLKRSFTSILSCPLCGSHNETPTSLEVTIHLAPFNKCLLLCVTSETHFTEKSVCIIKAWTIFLIHKFTSVTRFLSWFSKIAVGVSAWISNWNDVIFAPWYLTSSSTWLLAQPFIKVFKRKRQSSSALLAFCDENSPATGGF